MPHGSHFVHRQSPDRAPPDLLRRASCRGRSGLGPVDLEPALGEQPDAVLLDELVEVPQGSDHHRAFAILAYGQMMGHAVGLPGGAVAVQYHRALAVDVGGGYVAVEIVEDLGEG